jgi:uncharacterized membrane protein YqjE
MTNERPDLPALFQRLADALVRLAGERFDLARVELREDLGRILGQVGELLLGAVAAGVGTVLLAVAATDALAPWVASRAVRLALVGSPLTLYGVLRVRAAAARLTRERLRVSDAARALRDDLAALGDLGGGDPLDQP